MIFLKSLPPTLQRLGPAEYFVIAGLCLRIYHYLVNHTIWYDESVLLFNVLDKDYSRLTGPLDYAVAVPPLFAWLLRFVGANIADNPYVWRLIPLLGGCLGLLLTYRVAKRFMSSSGGVIFVGLVAICDAHIWLSLCIKPYIFDALCATTLIYMFMATCRLPLHLRLLLFSIAAPPILLLSYPGIFLLGGVVLAFVPAVWRDRGWPGTLAFVSLSLVVASVFLMQYFGPMQAQRDPNLVAEWRNKFPNWDRLSSVPGWVFGNTAIAFHYCYNPVGAGCIGLAIIGAIRFVREGRPELVALTAGPIFLALGAAFVHAYPFSNNRLILFLAPGYGVLVAEGAPSFCTWLRRFSRYGPSLMMIMMLAPCGVYSAYHIFSPWNQPATATTVAHIRSNRTPGDLVASDDATYHYFFRGEFRSLTAIGEGKHSTGQRVWAPMDHYDPVMRLAHVRTRLTEKDWDLKEEIITNRSSVFLFVKR